MKIAHLGIAGSFSYIAAKTYFPGAEYLSCKTFKDIFTAVESGEAEYGAVPVENSLAGSVYDNYDLLYKHDVYVKGEYDLKIAHHLLVSPGTGKLEERLKKITKVYSHIKALEQCDDFFASHPWMEETVYSDTATAAQLVAEKPDETTAAIANETAAELYHLEVLKAHIEDNANNYTRFVIISKQENHVTEANKCSLILTLSHTPGSLYRALEIFSRNGANLTKIESRPIMGKPFEYIFYIDIEFAQVDFNKIRDLIASELKTNTQTLKVLGFYHAARREF